VDDAFFATVSFASGAVGQLTFSWAGHGAPTSLPDRRVIYGTRGCLKGDSLILDDGSVHSAAKLFQAQASAQLKAELFPLGLADPFAIGALDFLHAIENGRDPEASGEQGLLDLAAAYAICESATAARPVSVLDVLEGRVATYQADINRHYGLA
jgi:predicted dehydrogenase